MTDFELMELGSQPTAVIRATSVAVIEIPVVLAELLPAAWGYLQERSLSAAGPPFVRYSNMTDATFDLEAGFPVAVPIEGDGRVVADELPGGLVATGWHIGPYATIGTTYDALVAWVVAAGRRPGEDMWEVYWSDPETTPPDELRTQVFCPELTNRR